MPGLAPKGKVPVAGRIRHLKVKDERFQARMAGPAARLSLLAKLGGTTLPWADRRDAMKALSSGVAPETGSHDRNQDGR